MSNSVQLMGTHVLFRKTGSYSLAGPFFVLAAIFATQVALGLRLSSIPKDALLPLADDGHAFQPSLMRVVSFGHLQSTVDWLWITALTDLRAAHVVPGTHSAFYYRIAALTDLDPLGFEYYTIGGNLLAIVQDDGDGARVLLEKGESFLASGLKALPDSFARTYWDHPWQIPLLLGYVYLFELNQMPKAAGYFKEASTYPGSPRYLASLQRRLELPGGEYEVGLKLLSFMVSGAHDAKVRERLEKKRFSLFVSQYVHQVGQEFMGYAHDVLGYRSGQALEPARLEGLWARFRKERGVPLLDPWGGHLSIDSTGKVLTTTPRDKVFGLE